MGIYCRDNVYYNLQNPTEVQKNMKCKEAPCDVERFGVACYNHPANRQRRDTEFEMLSDVVLKMMLMHLHERRRKQLQRRLVTFNVTVDIDRLDHQLLSVI